MVTTLIVGFPGGASLGGPPCFIYSSIFMAIITVTVAIIMEELASVLPRSGIQYY